MSTVQAPRVGRRVIQAGVAVAGPVALTAVLSHLGSGQSRDYAFLYLGLVAALGLSTGIVASLIAAAASFLLVDYYFVPPEHTLSIADETDLVNLLVFFATAATVGGLTSRRRAAQLEAEALSRHLQSANTELERLNRDQAEAARTAVRLAQAQQQVHLLEETDRLRRELLQNVSHELRTPLASVLMGTTAMLGGDDIPTRWHETLEGITTQTRRLNRLVGDMLDMARIEGGVLDLHLDDVDMAEAAATAADRLRAMSPERVVAVQPGPGPLDVVADWDRVAQVLDNLLINADRYAPAGTPIEVRVSRGARGTVVTQVVDHGSGVAPGLREHVFERFVAKHEPDGGAETESTGGTGLGLAIVRGLIEAQAGRVWLDEPEPGATGARFAFSLPAAPGAAQ